MNRDLYREPLDIDIQPLLVVPRVPLEYSQDSCSEKVTC